MKKTLVMLALSLGVMFTASAQYANDFVKIGMPAPELAYPNPEGKEIKLSEINKGRYVLLDCWASWCGPCRASNPGLVKIYNEFSKKKFKNAKKGFTVVSFSLDQKKEAWIAAIAKDGLIWPNHMSDLKGWQSVVSQSYGISYIPQAFLIGPDGTILGKYGRAEEALDDIKKYAE